jgi:hypothetical protein
VSLVSGIRQLVLTLGSRIPDAVVMGSGVAAAIVADHEIRVSLLNSDTYRHFFGNHVFLG